MQNYADMNNYWDYKIFLSRVIKKDKTKKTNLQYSQTLDTLYCNHPYKFRLCGDIVSSVGNSHRVVCSSLQTSYYRILKEKQMSKTNYRKMIFFGVFKTF